MAISYLYSKKTKPTAISIWEVLPDKQTREAVEELGGMGYISKLQSIQSIEGSIGIYVNKIKQASTRRSIIDVCKATENEMLSDTANVLNESELIGTIQKKLNDLAIAQSTDTEVYKFGDKTDEVLRERATKPNQVPGLETGWKQLDKITNGGQPGDLIFVAARSKTGKSVTLLNWAIQMGIHDKMPILFIDTEMSSREQEDRILSNLSGVPQSEIVSGIYVLDTENGKGSYKIEQLNKAKQMMRDGNLHHIYMPSFTLEKLTNQVRKFQMQYGIVALFFDYLKFPASMVTSLKQAAEWQMLGFLASGLKDLAGVMKIPVYSAVQENRTAVDSDQKGAGSIGGSDRILQLATKLMFLYNKDPEKIAKYGMQNGNQELYVAFQRNGESDCKPINIIFHKNILKQEEA
jgi:replicative DNA helicase